MLSHLTTAINNATVRPWCCVVTHNYEGTHSSWNWLLFEMWKAVCLGFVLIIVCSSYWENDCRCTSRDTGGYLQVDWECRQWKESTKRVAHKNAEGEHACIHEYNECSGCWVARMATHKICMYFIHLYTNLSNIWEICYYLCIYILQLHVPYVKAMKQRKAD